jgi:hypothetical protein
MKRKKEPTLFEIQQRGLDALTRELGPGGLCRFFQIFGMGKGDYTRDRHKWLGETTVEQIAAKIEVKKKGK